MAIKAVLFDLDGTLVDSFELVYQFASEILDQSGHGHVSKRRFREKVVLPFARTARRFGLHIPDKELRNAYLESIMTKARRIHAFPDAHVTLRNLNEHRYVTALVTEAPRDLAVKYLKSFGLRKYFRLLVTKEDVASSKPSPEPILRALHSLDCNSHEALYVGDMVEDVLSARKAKVFSCVVYRRGQNFHSLYRLKKSRPDLLLTSLHGLESGIRGLDR